MKASFQEKPEQHPTARTGGGEIKPITRVLLDRRATASFRQETVPEEHLNANLRFGAQAPSGYNLQPWRFIVVRDPANLKRLQKAAMHQEKVSEPDKTYPGRLALEEIVHQERFGRKWSGRTK